MSKRSKQFPSAMKHGAYSGTTLLPGEDKAAYEKLHKELIAELAPNGPLEADIVETIARLLWRKQNLSTYRLAKEAKARVSAIRFKIVPQPPQYDLSLMGMNSPPDTRDPEEVRAAERAADERAERELGQLMQLVDMGEVATIDHLYEELSIIDRLDRMIDPYIKRLLMVRGFKSISAPASAAPTPKRLAAG